MYGEPKPYQSPLRVYDNYPALVSYVDSKTGENVGRVYRTDDGRWYLATPYFDDGRPLEVFAKYKGFLFLNQLHSTRHA